MTVSWTAPDNGGSPITSYTIYLLTNAGDYITYTDHCDGSDSTIMAQAYCVIPSIDLHETSFLLPWASSIWAKVVATNLYGDSATSEAGNGATIVAVPDKPISLAEDYSQRSASTLGLTWEDGADPGGLPVLDYRITITSASIGFSQLVLGVSTKSYTAVNLVAGLNYDFKVESRNSYGYSALSDPITMLCAWKPEPPSAPTTYVVGNQAFIDWSEPVLNGVPITGYEIYLL